MFEYGPTAATAPVPRGGGGAPACYLSAQALALVDLASWRRTAVLAAALGRGALRFRVLQSPAAALCLDRANLHRSQRPARRRQAGDGAGAGFERLRQLRREPGADRHLAFGAREGRRGPEARSRFRIRADPASRRADRGRTRAGQRSDRARRASARRSCHGSPPRTHLRHRRHRHRSRSRARRAARQRDGARLYRSR